MEVILSQYLKLKKRYDEGFKNLNTHFKYFDSLDVFDCSVYKSEPQFCFSMANGKQILYNTFPEFLKSLIPDIAIEIKA